MSNFQHSLTGVAEKIGQVELKFDKTTMFQVFETMLDLKGPPTGPTFWSGFETLDHLAPAWWSRPFSRQK